MKVFKLFMNSEQRNQLKNTEQQLIHMEKQIELFNSRFSDNGWCANDSINFSLIEKANATYEKENLNKLKLFCSIITKTI